MPKAEFRTAERFKDEPTTARGLAERLYVSSLLHLALIYASGAPEDEQEASYKRLEDATKKLTLVLTQPNSDIPLVRLGVNSSALETFSLPQERSAYAYLAGMLADQLLPEELEEREKVLQELKIPLKPDDLDKLENIPAAMSLWILAGRIPILLHEKESDKNEISQLKASLTAKTTEASDLRTENRALRSGDILTEEYELPVSIFQRETEDVEKDLTKREILETNMHTAILRFYLAHANPESSDIEKQAAQRSLTAATRFYGNVINRDIPDENIPEIFTEEDAALELLPRLTLAEREQAFGAAIRMIAQEILPTDKDALGDELYRLRVPIDDEDLTTADGSLQISPEISLLIMHAKLVERYKEQTADAHEESQITIRDQQQEIAQKNAELTKSQQSVGELLTEIAELRAENDTLKEEKEKVQSLPEELQDGGDTEAPIVIETQPNREIAEELTLKSMKDELFNLLVGHSIADLSKSSGVSVAVLQNFMRASDLSEVSLKDCLPLAVYLTSLTSEENSFKPPSEAEELEQRQVICGILRQFREARNLSQTKLASLLGMDKRILSSVETGKTILTADLLEPIVALLMEGRPLPELAVEKERLKDYVKDLRVIEAQEPELTVENVGNAIAFMRNRDDISQADLMPGWRLAKVSKIETGRKKISLEEYRLLLQKFVHHTGTSAFSVLEEAYTQALEKSTKIFTSEYGDGISLNELNKLSGLNVSAIIAIKRGRFDRVSVAALQKFFAAAQQLEAHPEDLKTLKEEIANAKRRKG